MLKLVSHNRTGTHYLMHLLYNNVCTGATCPEDIHFSHSQMPPDDPFLHLWRPLYPVMLSMWRCRDHLGIAREVTFSQMLRTPWETMPRASDAPYTYLNGKVTDRVTPPRSFTGTLPDRWLERTQTFAANAVLTVSYDDAVSRPLYVIDAVCATFRTERFSSVFVPVFDRVGWYNVRGENPVVTYDDLELMEGVQRCLRLQ